MMWEDRQVVCERFRLENIDIDRGDVLDVRRFGMQVRGCDMGDSDRGDCRAQVHLRVRFFAVVRFRNGASQNVAFERCLTFDVPRGVFCHGDFSVEGQLLGIRVRRTRRGATISFIVQICLIADPRRDDCLQGCGDACGCSCGCGDGCGCNDDNGDCPCRAASRAQGVTLPYSLAGTHNSCGCMGMRTASCGCGASGGDAWATRAWTLPDGSTYTANFGTSCSCTACHNAAHPAHSCGCMR